MSGSDGDVIVIGPECFVTKDGSVLCWKGVNYVPQPDEALSYPAGAYKPTDSPVEFPGATGG